jgi:sulfite reductase beta subunit-like hemoprotein
MAELGLVGDGPNSYQVPTSVAAFLCSYGKKIWLEFWPETCCAVFVDQQIWLGGTPNQTNLAQAFKDKVKLQDLEKVFEPLFYYWKTERESDDEAFGSLIQRVVCLRLLKRNASFFYCEQSLCPVEVVYEGLMFFCLWWFCRVYQQ